MSVKWQQSLKSENVLHRLKVAKHWQFGIVSKRNFAFSVLLSFSKPSCEGKNGQFACNWGSYDENRATLKKQSRNSPNAPKLTLLPSNFASSKIHLLLLTAAVKIHTRMCVCWPSFVHLYSYCYKHFPHVLWVNKITWLAIKIPRYKREYLTPQGRLC